MAGDWIKMRVDLRDDPSVISIGANIDCDDLDIVVGKLHRLWSWADAHTTDGNAIGVTEKWIDRYVSVSGFARAMANAGWLLITEDGITFPSFNVHNGKSAKTRALTAKRVSAHRNASVTQAALPREEKRREEKRVKNTPPNPQGGDEHFDQFWQAFPSRRKQGKDAARKAWARVVKTTPPEVVVAAAKEYAASPVGQGEYVKGPVPWLNQGCWEDDRAAWNRRDTNGTIAANGHVTNKPGLYDSLHAFLAESGES